MLSLMRLASLTGWEPRGPTCARRPRETRRGRHARLPIELRERRRLKPPSAAEEQSRRAREKGIKARKST
jgi:hypothetical protein